MLDTVRDSVADARATATAWRGQLCLILARELIALRVGGAYCRIAINPPGLSAPDDSDRDHHDHHHPHRQAL